MTNSIVLSLPHPRAVDVRPVAELLLASPPATFPTGPLLSQLGSSTSAPHGASPCAVSATLANSPAVTRASADPVNFVCFPRASAANYRDKIRSKAQLEVGAPVPFTTACGRTTRLTRLPQFFDGTHIARVDWYRGIARVPLLHGMPLGKGQFTEDNLGLHMLALARGAACCEAETPHSGAPPEGAVIKGDEEEQTAGKLSTLSLDGGSSKVTAGVLSVVRTFGGWLWNDSDDTVIFHIDGRIFLSAAERSSRGIPDTVL